MNNSVFNPFLPAGEYIPDGEPRVFGDRVYLYGSHDRFNGAIFCLNDYVSYSAPLENLSDWRYEGIIYRKTQDPGNRLGLRLLFAPDVVQGSDNRYYLYYTLDFSGIMGVAVSDRPSGPFSFHGHIRDSGGARWGRRTGDHLPFDPGVLVDRGRVYLYSGFAVKIPAPLTGFRSLKSEGGVVVELETDMITIKKEPLLLFPAKGPGSYSDHEFFEASSIRKINDLYYFIYSSRHNHELCYAVSERPDSGFQFAGTLVSLGDIGLSGITQEGKGRNYLGNTHGSLLQHNGKFFIFYHRQTNRNSFSRQACAEELPLGGNGLPVQAEVTSCGLNGKPLPGSGEYGAYIACNLGSLRGVGRYDSYCPRFLFRKHPYITQEGKDGRPGAYQYIANMQNGALVGFKYFEFVQSGTITIKARGAAEGEITVFCSEQGDKVAEFPLHLRNRRRWTEIRTSFSPPVGVHPLYFRFSGKGKMDFLSFTFLR
ncbi:family 43 glycosylhydrolase [Spirochaeta isovalerica]|uniref:Beta-xylosidase n=1 Tax=Spirochaeta isovalerica TaxID=150 RepID=A0A841R7M2_9SPIO|nr:family 43 glycosylhydrolase [Spirochaeta isovalerica]MBB6479855.1 hypothetical protein [Spirochaeta isovalerica]